MIAIHLPKDHPLWNIIKSQRIIHVHKPNKPNDNVLPAAKTKKARKVKASTGAKAKPRLLQKQARRRPGRHDLPQQMHMRELLVGVPQLHPGQQTRLFHLTPSTQTTLDIQPMSAKWSVYWIDKVPTVRVADRFATTGEVGELHFQDYDDIDQASNDVVKMQEHYPQREIRIGRIAELDWHP